MATHLEKLSADMKAALRAKEAERLRVIRSLIHAIKQEQHARGGADLDDGAELAVLRKAAKSLREAIAQARERGRDDVATGLQAELAIVETYLPPRMSEAELDEKVRALAEEIGYQGPKDKGRFMKEWMARYKGLAEGGDVQRALDRLG